MEVAAKLGTSLALSALSPLLNKLTSKIGGDVTDEEMQHLNDFVRFKIVALTRETNSDDLVQSMPLLEKLQAAALEVEDLLDLYEYNQIEKQVSSSSSNCIKEFIRICIDWLRPILPKSPLRIGVEKLLKFVEQVEKIHPFITSRTGTTQPQPSSGSSSTSILLSPYFGRKNQCDKIIEFLLDESHSDSSTRTNKVPVIAIIGMGGSGKTHTAKRIFNDDKIKNYFDANMWVHVRRDFDVVGLTRKMVESANNDGCPQITSLDVLQKKLKESLSTRKNFLLVLDDWCEDKKKWDVLAGPLNEFVQNGSKIIITTWNDKIADNLHANKFHLEDLKAEDCWSILKYYAFHDYKECVDYQELFHKYDQKLINVGNQIISKAKRSPLALKVVGRLLHKKIEVDKWEKLLEQDILKETMDLLLFSYHRLPSHLQRCFAYCSLFSKGYRFSLEADDDIDEPYLTLLWIAQGFVENVTQGRKYIEELISYSFFERRDGNYFVIHDLLHDLAENVSKKQCHRIEHHDLVHIPTTCIHLSLSKLSYLAISNILELRSLRTLIIFQVDVRNIFKNKIEIFQNLTKLRAFYVDVGEQTEVLSNPHIDKLKHLRYLHVRYDRKLPVSLAKLYQLQFFILTTYMVDVNGMISLKNLHLHGPRLILILNIICKKEAEKTILILEKDLNNLVFEWSGTPSSIDIYEQVLEGLEPHENLEKLKINNYLGVKFPKWMVKENRLPRLQTLKLSNCKSLKIIPILPPLLLKLDVCRCDELMHIPPLSDTLHTLCLVDCPNLQALTNMSPTVTQLLIEDCPKLTSLGRNLQCCTSLERVKIRKCPMLRREEASLVEGVVEEDIANRLPHVERIETDEPLLIFELVGQQAFSSIEWLNLSESDCAALPNLEMLSSLQNLDISDCRDLESLPNFPVSVQLLKLYNCPKLLLKEKYEEGGPLHLDLKGCAALSNLEKLSSLKRLSIQYCPDVELLPNLPISLQSLWVYGCPKLKEKYEEGGPLRNTISHIPHIDIWG